MRKYLAQRLNPARVLAILVVGVLIYAVVANVAGDGGGEEAALLKGLAVLLVAGIPIAWLLIEDARARSIAFDEEGLEALFWNVGGSFPFLTLKRLRIPWQHVQKAKVIGGGVVLATSTRKLTISMYLLHRSTSTLELLRANVPVAAWNRDAL